MTSTIFMKTLPAKTISDFTLLGNTLLQSLETDELAEIASLAMSRNPWFTLENIKLAVRSIATKWLNEASMIEWLSKYEIRGNRDAKVIGLVCAGNIPLVCWHDVMCILVSGHTAQIKLSSKDEVLPNFLISKLREINNDYESKISVVDKLENFDAVIATGSNNTSRYFEYYFSRYPHVIRKSRTSIAIIQDADNDQDYRNLGSDIFSYFGMGCRNVSKIFIPENFDLKKVLDQFEGFAEVGYFNKYHNNYMFQKSIYLLNKVDHLDNGFMLFRKDDKMGSPTGVLFYEEYTSLEALKIKTMEEADAIQCIAGNPIRDINTVPFGHTQSPELWNYADGVDTLQFLLSL